jgi:hypothetical protein
MKRFDSIRMIAVLAHKNVANAAFAAARGIKRGKYSGLEVVGELASYPALSSIFEDLLNHFLAFPDECLLRKGITTNDLI